MQENELEEKIKLGKMHGIYLFYGENSFSIEFMIKKIKNSFVQLIQGINYINIDENNIDNLLPEMQTPPFGYDTKFIFVKNSGLMKKEAKTKSTVLTKKQEQIKEYIENNIEYINSYILLIFYEEKVEKNSLYQTIEKNGYICCFENLNNATLIKKLVSICKAYNVHITESVAKKFIEFVGTDMQENINEIRKLIEYVGKDGTITEKEIELLTVKKIDAVIFDLTDALGMKDIDKSIRVLKDLLYNKEPIQKILITLYNHFKKLYIISLALRYNKVVAQCLNLKANQTFLIGKYKKQASYFNEQTLRKILKELTSLDISYKQGKIDLETGLIAVLCNYCSK